MTGPRSFDMLEFETLSLLLDELPGTQPSDDDSGLKTIADIIHAAARKRQSVAATQ